jgi:hypothetical protein
MCLFADLYVILQRKRHMEGHIRIYEDDFSCQPILAVKSELSPIWK